jgi:PAS domain S-box-containing protein
MRDSIGSSGKSTNSTKNSQTQDPKADRAGSGTATTTDHLKETLRNSEQKYRRLVEDSIDGIAIISGDKIVFANQALVEMVGCRSEDELLGRGFTDFVAPEHREMMAERARARLRGENVPRRYEFKALRKDGSEFDVETCSGRIALGDITVLQAVIRDITEHKQAQAALRRSEEQFRQIVENTAVGIYRTTPDGRILMANPALVRMLGYHSFEELAQRDLQDQTCYEPGYPRSSFVKRIEEEGEIVGLESAWKRRDGTTLYIIEDARAIRDEHGKTLYYEGTVENITDRKLAEQALRDREARLRAIFEAAKDVSFILTDVDGQDAHILEFSPGAERIFGYRRDEVVGKPVAILHLPEDVKRFPRVLAAMSENKQGFVGESTLVRKSGERFPALFTTSPVLDDQGNMTATIGVSIDITEHKRAEEALRQSEQSYRELANSITDIFFAMDKDLRYTYWNRASEELTGVKVQDAIGKTIFEIFPGNEATRRAVRMYREVLQTRQPKSFVNQYQLGGRNFIFEVNAYPTGHGVSIFVRDITERKRAERKLLDYQDKLRSFASELALAEERERRRIATSLHDQIGQSLAVTKIKLDALRHSMPGGQYLQVLEELCNSLGDTIAQTRSLTFDLSSPILHELGFEAAVASWLCEQIETEHGITTEFHSDQQPKPMDEGMRVLLFRSVRELLINIVKHANASKVRVSSRRIGHRIEVIVADNGIGFDSAETLAKATTKGGFGLFSVRERLEKLAGHLQIESKPGRGCKVTMTAPLQLDEK